MDAILNASSIKTHKQEATETQGIRMPLMLPKFILKLNIETLQEVSTLGVQGLTYE